MYVDVMQYSIIPEHKPTMWALELTYVSKWQWLFNNKGLTEASVELKWGPYIPMGRATIGCDPSQPNPWTSHVHGRIGGQHSDCS